MAKVELSEAAKEARRTYIQAWRKKHPDKVRQYTANHWENVARKAAQLDQDNAGKE